ncbi:PE family protein [Mycobacterium kansasii]|uniref:PE family protein n=1 Tax=Mycobacterium kansasii TaxID=1768 RepID=A0A1V3XZY2_MYCKA|nr:PE family protein [Mycobacterium kansasii]
MIAAPDAIATASGNLTGIEEAIRKAAAAASSSTTRIAVAAADEVSTAIATLFGGYAQEFQTLVARTTLFHNEFSRALSAAGAAYAAAEAANAAPLGSLLAQVGSLFSPLERLLGPPLIGGPGSATLGALLNSATNAVGLGAVLNFPSTVLTARAPTE